MAKSDKSAAGKTPPIKDSINAIAKVIKKLGAARAAALADRLAKKPHLLRRIVPPLEAVGPTPRFLQPDIPCEKPLSELGMTHLQIELDANIYWEDNYTLVIFKDGDDEEIQPIFVGDADDDDLVINTSATYILDAASFDGEGDYILRLTANNISQALLDLGYGRASIEITILDG